MKTTFASLLMLSMVPQLWSESTAKVRFDRDIRPILSDRCFQCHGPDKENRKARLRLDLEAEAKKEVIVPGHPEKSELFLRLTHKETRKRMPPAKFGKQLTSQQIDLFRRWIKEGAKWTSHWAFRNPVRPKLPTTTGPWARNVIDAFIESKLSQQRMKPSSDAEKATLLRRVTLDLTGLPPTPGEVDAFLADNSPDAYERVVNRLLTSPGFGERMAVPWLDAARYGDTSVYHADGPRQMWAWRDHIVKSYNRNQPFDQFSIEQLAGDLLPGAKPRQALATGFLRNNGTTDEGGLIEEEYRVEYAVDRVKTTSMVWLGLTMECGQCHDHKYDPISQKDYYRFFAYFNVSADRGNQTRRGNAAPIINVLHPMSQQRLPYVRGQIQKLQAQLDAKRKKTPAGFATWLEEMQAKVKSGPPAPKDPYLIVPLNEGKGNVVSDNVDSKRKGRIRGKARWVNAHDDKGLSFDGRTFVDFGSVGDFERTESFSYGGWVKSPKGVGAVLARMDDHAGFRGYDLLISSGHLEVHIVHNWPNNAIKVRTNQKLKPNVWQHVFVTYDGTSQAKGIKIYVDGSEWKWRIEKNALTQTIRTKKPLFLGSRNPGGRLQGELDDVRMYRRALSAIEVKALVGDNPLAVILNKPADKRSKAEQSRLLNYYLENVDKEYRSLQAEQRKLRAEEASLQKPLTTVMVMRDMPKPRQTFVLTRGAYDSPSKVKVLPGIPSVLPPMPTDAPKNRLGLARWMFQKDNPLTARVAVNRIWQIFFGKGLVTTPADFGSQGAYPSHPKLLDWLAVEFRESGWDVKRLVKLIVTSSTYRQSSTVTKEHLEKDPTNRYLARAPRFRLQGELVRDTALSVSGLLLRQMGGPGVKPYQPPGLWREVGLGGNPVFRQDHGDKLYRRSLYTYWKRSAPPPSMQIFDAPTREKCIVGRSRTNTPLQALVTLNDVQFVEAARAFAQLVMNKAKTEKERIGLAFQRATGRRPKASEVGVISEVYQHALKKYQKDPDAAKKLLSIGESPRDASLNVSEHAAWTVVTNMILNLDEVLTKE